MYCSVRWRPPSSPPPAESAVASAFQQVGQRTAVKPAGSLPQERPHPTDTPPLPRCQLAHLDRRVGTPPDSAPATDLRQWSLVPDPPGQHLGTVDRPLPRGGARTGEHGQARTLYQAANTRQGEFNGIPGQRSIPDRPPVDPRSSPGRSQIDLWSIRDRPPVDPG